MKAWVKQSPSADTIELTDVPVPSIDDDELLVRVRAIGVGIHDSYFLPTDVSYPFPIGIEAAGVVELVGDAVSGYSRGDRIAFVSAMQPKGGTWAGYAAVKSSSLIVPIPSALGFTEAAALPVAGSTILRAMYPLAIPSGGSLFVAGASGAIGTLAIQLAHRKGWQVAASASRKNHGYMLSLGAAKVVDYNDADWPEQIRQWMPGGVDAAIAVQPGTSSGCVEVVRDGGQVVTVSGDQAAPKGRVRVEMIPYEVDVLGELKALAADVADGRVRLALETHPFEEGLVALQNVQSRHARGKTVLTLEPQAG